MSTVARLYAIERATTLSQLLRESSEFELFGRSHRGLTSKTMNGEKYLQFLAARHPIFLWKGESNYRPQISTKPTHPQVMRTNMKKMRNQFVSAAALTTLSALVLVAAIGLPSELAAQMNYVAHRLGLCHRIEQSARPEVWARRQSLCRRRRNWRLELDWAAANKSFLLLGRTPVTSLARASPKSITTASARR